MYVCTLICKYMYSQYMHMDMEGPGHPYGPGVPYTLAKVAIC